VSKAPLIFEWLVWEFEGHEPLGGWQTMDCLVIGGVSELALALVAKVAWRSLIPAARRAIANCMADRWSSGVALLCFFILHFPYSPVRMQSPFSKKIASVIWGCFPCTPYCALRIWGAYEPTRGLI
jgi:hypothetical protein